MIFFRDGPAEACPGLLLRRAPLFLRVVQGKAEWDALDQLNDQPKPDETIYVYRREGPASRIHIYGQKVRGIFCNAYYRLVQPQPPDSVMRNTKPWQLWAREQMRMPATESTEHRAHKEGRERI